MNDRRATQAVSLFFAALLTIATFAGIDTLASAGGAPSTMQAAASTQHG